MSVFCSVYIILCQKWSKIIVRLGEQNPKALWKNCLVHNKTPGFKWGVFFFFLYDFICFKYNLLWCKTASNLEANYYQAIVYYAEKANIKALIYREINQNFPTLVQKILTTKKVLHCQCEIYSAKITLMINKSYHVYQNVGKSWHHTGISSPVVVLSQPQNWPTFLKDY